MPLSSSIFGEEEKVLFINSLSHMHNFVNLCHKLCTCVLSYLELDMYLLSEATKLVLEEGIYLHDV